MVVELKPELAGALVDAIEHEYYVARSRVHDAVRREASFNVIHLGTMVKVDLFVSLSDAYDQECLDRGHMEALTDASESAVMVASPEDVVLNKLIWYRKGGETANRQWLDVLGILRVQRNLDATYMNRWAPRLRVADLLERALAEAVENE